MRKLRTAHEIIYRGFARIAFAFAFAFGWKLRR
jgi:hypothetical protein